MEDKKNYMDFSDEQLMQVVRIIETEHKEFIECLCGSDFKSLVDITFDKKALFDPLDLTIIYKNGQSDVLKTGCIIYHSRFVHINMYEFLERFKSWSLKFILDKELPIKLASKKLKI